MAPEKQERAILKEHSPSANNNKRGKGVQGQPVDIESRHAMNFLDAPALTGTFLLPNFSGAEIQMFRCRLLKADQ